MLGKLNSIIPRLAAILLMLVLVTTSIVSGRYARYTASATANDSARVAKFSVTQTANFIGDGTQTKTLLYGQDNMISVTNDSEVAVRYSIEITTVYGNMPLRFSVSQGEGENEVVTELTEVEEGKYLFSADMAPNSTAEYNLIAQLAANTDDAFAGMVDLIQITLKATQID